MTGSLKTQCVMGQMKSLSGSDAAAGWTLGGEVAAVDLRGDAADAVWL